MAGKILWFPQFSTASCASAPRQASCLGHPVDIHMYLLMSSGSSGEIVSKLEIQTMKRSILHFIAAFFVRIGLSVTASTDF